MYVYLLVCFLGVLIYLIRYGHNNSVHDQENTIYIYDILELFIKHNVRVADVVGQGLHVDITRPGIH